MPQMKFVNFLFFEPALLVGERNHQLVNFRECFENIRGTYQEIRRINDRLYEIRNEIEEGIQDHRATELLTEREELLERRPNKLVYRFDTELARLATVSYDQGYFHLLFERLFDVEVPIKTELSGESEPMEVEEGEFIGNQVSLLYDPDLHIFMIQRNRDSLGPKALEGLLRSIIEDHFEVNEEILNSFVLSLKYENNPQAKALTKNIYKKFHFEVTANTKDNLVQRLLDVDQPVEGIESIEITLKADRTRRNGIDREQARELIHNYFDNPDLSKMDIRGKVSEGDYVEAVDLIEQKYTIQLDFVLDNRRHLNPVAVFERMIVEYTRNNGPRSNFQRERGAANI